MAQDLGVRIDNNTRIERPDIVKSKFNNSGDMVKDLATRNMAESLTNVNTTLTSIKDFLVKRTKYEKEDYGSNFAHNEIKIEKDAPTISNIKDMNNVQDAELVEDGGTITNIKDMKDNMDSLVGKFTSFVQDMKRWMKDTKYNDELARDQREEQIEGLSSLKNSKLLRTLFLIVSVGLVILLTKVMNAVNTFSMALSGITKLFKFGEKIPLLGKLFTPIIKGLTGTTGFLGKISGFIKSFMGESGALGKFMKWGFKFFGMSAKFAKAVPVIGQAVAIIMAVFDAFSGFFKADEIFGRVTTFGEKMVASLSSVLSGLTLGLIDTKTFANMLQPLSEWFETIKNFAVGVFDIFDKLVGFFKGTNTADELVDTVVDVLWGTVKGLVKSVLVSLPKVTMNVLAGTLKFLVSTIPKLFTALVASILGKISNMFYSLSEFFGEDSILGTFFATFGDIFQMASIGFDMLSSVFSELGVIIDNVKSYVNSFFDWIGSFFDTLEPLIETTKSVFGVAIEWFTSLSNKAKGVVAKVKSALDGVWNAFTGIVSTIKDKIFGMVSGIAGALNSALGGIPQTIASNIMSGLSAVGDFMGGIAGTFITSIMDAIKKIPGVGWVLNKLTGGDKKDVIESEDKVKKANLESESQSTESSELKETMKYSKPVTDDKSSFEAKQTELYEKQNRVLEQMLNRLAPQTNVAFN